MPMPKIPFLDLFLKPTSFPGIWTFPLDNSPLFLHDVGHSPTPRLQGGTVLENMSGDYVQGECPTLRFPDPSILKSLDVNSWRRL